LRYLAELDRADRDASTVPPSRDLKEKLAKVKEQMRSLGEIGEQMKSSVDGQLSMTDPDEKAGTWHRLTLNDRIGERATTGAQPGTTAGPLYLPVRVLIFDLRERPELAGTANSWSDRERRLPLQSCPSRNWRLSAAKDWEVVVQMSTLTGRTRPTLPKAELHDWLFWGVDKQPMSLGNGSRRCIEEPEDVHPILAQSGEPTQPRQIRRCVLSSFDPQLQFIQRVFLAIGEPRRPAPVDHEKIADRVQGQHRVMPCPTCEIDALARRRPKAANVLGVHGRVGRSHDHQIGVISHRNERLAADRVAL
jgi:hypothetical protein